VGRLRGLKKNDFDVKLGSILVPELRDALQGEPVRLPGGEVFISHARYARAHRVHREKIHDFFCSKPSVFSTDLRVRHGLVFPQ
jgi:hypothetical protein